MFGIKVQIALLCCVIIVSELPAQDFVWEKVVDPSSGAGLHPAGSNEFGLVVGRSFDSGYVLDDPDRGWRPLANSIANRFTSIVVSPVGTLIASVGDTLYRSVDTARSWQATLSAWEGRLKRDRRGHIYGLPDRSTTGLVRSTDDGLTWRYLRNGLDSSNKVVNVAASDDERLFTVGAQGEIMQWNEAEDRWILHGRVKFAHTLGFDREGGILLALSQSVGRYYPETNRYVRFFHRLDGTSLGNQRFIADATGNLYLSTLDPVLYKLEHNTGQWRTIDISAMVSQGAYDLLPVPGNRMIILSQRGVYLFNFADESIVTLNKGLREFEIQRFITTPRNTLIASVDRSMYRLADGAEEWEAQNIDTSFKQPFMGIKGIFAAYGDTLYAVGKYNVYRSLDDGRKWQTLAALSNEVYWTYLYAQGRIFFGDKNGLNFYDVYDKETRIMERMTQSMTEDADGRLYASQPGSKILISSDRGDTWTEGIVAADHDTQFRLDYSPFAGLLAISRSGTFASQDEGKSWSKLFSGRVEQIHAFDHNRLIVLKNYEVLYSVDFGVSLRKVGQGLPLINQTDASPLSQLGFQLSDDYIYLGIVSKSIYRSRLPVTSIENRSGTQSANALQIKVFPQPALEYLDITYTLARPAEIEVSVYSAAGRLIERQLLGYMPAGKHSARWNCGSAAGGLYFIRIGSDDQKHEVVSATIW